VLVEDITRRKRAETELIRSNEDLAQFAHAASHDLQEPLRTIASYTELLSRRYAGKLGEEADQFIKFALDAANRMHILIRDLLAFSQVHDQEHLPGGLVDTKQILEQAMANLKQAIDESKASITNSGLPTVEGDSAQLVQVFQNLLSNAIKYRGPEPPSVHISAKLQAGEWTFAFEDNGLGFESRDAKRIFDIFKRLHGRDIPGTGIGLALCKKIVERHGGRIWVESEPGKGSIFSFTIPALKAGHATAS
jgi:light-regulated signal transduction histidine kinase (bacteriophytochrome)